MRVLIERTPRKARAPPIPVEIWNRHRGEIETIYIEQGLTLEETRTELGSSYGFNPSKRQLTRQLEIWELFKNGPKSALRKASVLAESTASIKDKSSGMSIDSSDLVEPDLPPMSSPIGVREGIERGRSSLSAHDGQEPCDPENSKSSVISTSNTHIPNEPVDYMDVNSESGSEMILNEPRLSTEEIRTSENNATCGIQLMPQLVEKIQTTIDKTEDTSQEKICLPTKPDWPLSAEFYAHCVSAEKIVNSSHSLRYAPIEPGNEVPNPETSMGESSEELLRIKSLVRTIESPMPFAGTSSSGPMSLRNPTPSRKVSVLAFIATVAARKFQSPMTYGDLDQIQDVADVLTGAHCNDDAFSLSYFITQSCYVQNNFPQSSSLYFILNGFDCFYILKRRNEYQDFQKWQRFLISLLRNTKTLDQCRKIDPSWAKIQKSSSNDAETPTVMDCIQLSYMGVLDGLKKLFGRANTQCGLAHYTYHHVGAAGMETGAETVLRQNLMESLQYVRSGVRVIFPKPKNKGGIVLKALSNVLFWCISVLADEYEFSIFSQASCSVWSMPASENDMVLVDKVVLFCYFWTKWLQQQRPKSDHERSNWPATYNSQFNSNFTILYDHCHVSAVDVISSVATMIVKTSWAGEQERNKENFTRSVLRKIQKLQKNSLDNLFSNFLETYASISRGKEAGFSNDFCRQKTRDFVHRIINDHLELQLSDSALGGPVVPHTQIRDSVTPSITPTMLSTPRSSISGFASFISLHKRIPLLVSSENYLESKVKRRWSQISSTRSRLSILSGNSILRAGIADEPFDDQDVGNATAGPSRHPSPKTGFQLQYMEDSAESDNDDMEID